MVNLINVGPSMAAFNSRRQGKHKLNHQWTGPYKVTKKIVRCYLQNPTFLEMEPAEGNTFGRLEPCPSNMRFDVEATPSLHQQIGESSAASNNTFNTNPRPSLERGCG